MRSRRGPAHTGTGPGPWRSSILKTTCSLRVNSRLTLRLSRVNVGSFITKYQRLRKPLARVSIPTPSHLQDPHFNLKNTSEKSQSPSEIQKKTYSKSLKNYITSNNGFLGVGYSFSLSLGRSQGKGCSTRVGHIKNLARL